MSVLYLWVSQRVGEKVLLTKSLLPNHSDNYSTMTQSGQTELIFIWSTLTLSFITVPASSASVHTVVLFLKSKSTICSPFHYSSLILLFSQPVSSLYILSVKHSLALLGLVCYSQVVNEAIKKNLSFCSLVPWTWNAVFNTWHKSLCPWRECGPETPGTRQLNMWLFVERKKATAPSQYSCGKSANWTHIL